MMRSCDIVVNQLKGFLCGDPMTKTVVSPTVRDLREFYVSSILFGGLNRGKLTFVIQHVLYIMLIESKILLKNYKFSRYSLR